MTKNGLRPVHPGETLKEEYLEPLNPTPKAWGFLFRMREASWWLSTKAH